MRRTSPVVSKSCVTLFQIRIMKKMHSSLLQKHIKWSFSLPHWSHFGGIWERCIRTVRKILHALLQEQIADDQRLVTFRCEVESIMNSRPITPVSSDPNNMEPPHRTTCCFSSQKSLCHLVYSRRKIYFLVVRGSKYNILRIFSGEDGAGNTFPFWNLDKSG